jgi:hypothetical protein
MGSTHWTGVRRMSDSKPKQKTEPCDCDNCWETGMSGGLW